MKRLGLSFFFILFLGAFKAQNLQTFTDPRDNHTYKIVTIGNQTWMAENLAYLPRVSSPATGTDEEASSKPFYYVAGYHGDDTSEAKKSDNYKKYGVLYNYVAAKASCPPGWHLPSDEEWKTLERYLGMSAAQANEPMFRNEGMVGHKLKSVTGWSAKGGDSFGFAALPGGFRYGINPGVGNKGGFGYVGAEAFFWTSTIYREGFVYRRQLTSESKGIVRFPQMISHGYSVRCVKD